MEKKKSWKEIPIGGKILEPGSSRKYKTGGWRTFRPVWDKKRCTHCMFCVVYCPDACIPVKDDPKKITMRMETDLDYCKGCLICEEVCPVKCISHKEEGDVEK